MPSMYGIDVIDGMDDLTCSPAGRGADIQGHGWCGYMVDKQRDSRQGRACRTLCTPCRRLPSRWLSARTGPLAHSPFASRASLQPWTRFAPLFLYGKSLQLCQPRAQVQGRECSSCLHHAAPVVQCDCVSFQLRWHKRWKFNGEPHRRSGPL